MRQLALVACLVCASHGDSNENLSSLQALTALLLEQNPEAAFQPGNGGSLQLTPAKSSRTGAAVMAFDPYATPEGGYAIIEAQGRQMWLSEKRWYDFDRIPLEPGETFTLNKILLVKKSDDEKDMYVGKPYLQDWTVEGHILRHLRTKKVRVFKYKPKKGYRRTYGHRAYKTRCLITAIKKLENAPVTSPSMAEMLEGVDSTLRAALLDDDFEDKQKKKAEETKQEDKPKEKEWWEETNEKLEAMGRLYKEP